MRMRVFWPFLFVFYFLVACAFTWPLLTSLQDSVPGPGFAQKQRANEDSFQFLWNLWWAREAIKDFHNPFESPFLFHPQGARLYFNAHIFLHGVIAFPFISLFGLVAGANLALIFQLALGAFLAALLGWELTENRMAAWLSGIALGFCPFLFGRLQGHWCWSFVAPLVLVVLLLLRLKKNPSIRSALFLGVGFFLLGLADSTYLIFGFVITACLLAAGPDRKMIFRRLLISAAVFLALYSPILAGAYLEYKRGGDEAITRGRSEYFGADVAEYFTPNLAHPMLRTYRPFGRFVQRHRFLFEAKRLWPGLVVLALAASVGYWRTRQSRSPHTKWFAFVAAAGFLLSLGSPLRILSHRTVPFLYEVIDFIPILGDIRAPGRYGIVTQIGLVGLAAIGAGELARRYSWKPLLLAGTFLLFEFLPAPIPLLSTNVPETVETLAQQEYGAVWDVGVMDLETLLFQTVHQKPIVGGFHSRMWSYDRTPGRILRQLTRRASSGKPAAEEQLRQTLQSWKIRYVLTAPGTGTHRYFLRAGWLEVIHSADGWTLYRVS